ncbi:MAG: polysaccharide biosynthesis/export family protein [Candidatus Omnitrophica bacterium]|nr:polysaccharide biosynthesis/export family protein [Candidatus Omnitrophota bacterium]
MIQHRGIVWAALGLAALAGCSGMPIPIVGGGTPAGVLEEEYRLHPNDELEVTVWGQSDLHRNVTVREDGTFSFPFIGDVAVGGKTLREIERQMAQALAQGYINNPHVSTKLINQRFSVLGEVERPGSYTLEGRVDLLAALSMAGGLNKFASSRVEIIRALWDGQKTSYDVDVNAILSGRRPVVLVHPHDTIHVKRRLF